MLSDVRQSALQLLEATPRIVQLLLDQFPPSTLETPADGDWSPKDLIAHLFLTDGEGMFSRIHTITAVGDVPFLPNIDEEAQLNRSTIRSESVADILKRFTDQRAAHLVRVRALNDDALQLVGEHEVVGLVTAEELLFNAANHDCVHLRQLLSMLQSHFEPLRGPMRVY